MEQRDANIVENVLIDSAKHPLESAMPDSAPGAAAVRRLPHAQSSGDQGHERADAPPRSQDGATLPPPVASHPAAVDLAVAARKLRRGAAPQRLAYVELLSQLAPQSDLTLGEEGRRLPANVRPSMLQVRMPRERACASSADAAARVPARRTSRAVAPNQLRACS
jgi:hypothetical protein